MRLTIVREGKAAAVQIAGCLGHYGATTVTLTHTRDTEFDAALLTSWLERELWAQMQRIREDAYTRGYRDGRAKRGKLRYFSGGLAE